MSRALFLFGLIALLAGCDVERPKELTCATFPGGQSVAKSTQGRDTPTDAALATAEMVSRTEDQIESAIRAEVARTPARRTVTFDVITLSAGGQYGAFGAGFLTGWSQNRATPRPVFNLVTGVSAGATLAPAAFGGPRFDPLLRYYRGLGRDEVLRLRPLPAWLSAPSLGDPAPLSAFLDRALDAELLSAIATGHAEGRRLLIAATNIDTGAGEILDLGEAVSAPMAAPCLREAILASAAVPALFPPRNINGALYADGGLRQHVFLDAIDEARRTVERDAGVDIRVEAYIVVNGALRGPDRRVDDRLVAYTVRSLDTLADEVLRDSVEEAVAFAESRADWRVRGIRADLPPGTCAGKGEAAIGGFDPCLTRALFDHGVAMGTATPINWLSAADLRALAAEL